MKILSSTLVFIAVVVLVGCSSVTQEELADVRALAEKAATDAAAAQRDALAARNAADRAVAVAEAANDKARANSMAMERFFEQSMKK